MKGGRKGCRECCNGHLALDVEERLKLCFNVSALEETHRLATFFVSACAYTDINGGGNFNYETPLSISLSLSLSLCSINIPHTQFPPLAWIFTCHSLDVLGIIITACVPKFFCQPFSSSSSSSFSNFPFSHKHVDRFFFLPAFQWPHLTLGLIVLFRFPHVYSIIITISTIYIQYVCLATGSHNNTYKSMFIYST